MRLSDLAGRRVVIWGAGREAAATAGAIERYGIDAQVEIVDDAASGAASLEGYAIKRDRDKSKALNAADVVIRTPSISRYRDDVVAIAAKTTTATNLWFAEGFKNVVGITGTKGKSTTASLVAHLLASLGLEVALTGNIGRAPIDLLGREEPEWWVVELSSYQTSDLTASPPIGVLTSLSAEHLDWHGNEDTYRRDKLNMFAHDPNMQIVLNVADRGVAEISNSLGDHVLRANEAPFARVEGGFFQVGDIPIAPTNAFRLLGRHNWNLAATALTAVAATGVDIANHVDVLAHSLTTFEPLAHRLEIYRQLNGLTFVDDSIATTPAATIAALRAFEGREITVLVGGYDRGLSYDDFAKFVAHSRGRINVVALPDSNERIAKAIADAQNKASAVEIVDNLHDAVVTAIEITPQNGVILLSPGAPSFGRFNNYIERGLQFRKAVDEQIS